MVVELQFSVVEKKAHLGGRASFRELATDKFNKHLEYAVILPVALL